jgi:hypothetical protein
MKSRADRDYVADQMGHANLTMLQKWKPGKTTKPSTNLIDAALGRGF